MTPALVLSTLLLLPLGAKGRGTEARVAQGQSEFNRGNFAQAIKVLDAAAADTTDDGLLARIHLLRGQAFAAQQQFDEAEGAFQLALEHDPEASLDPAKVDPQLVRMLDGLRDRMKGELTVRAEIPGSKVMLDGRYIGESPASANPTIGRHKVEVVSPDGRRGGKAEVVVWSKRMTESSVQQDETREPKKDKDRDNAPSATSSRRGFADLRGNWNPLQLIDGLGFEIGGGVEQEYLRGSLHVRLFPGLGLTPRGGLHVPINEKLDGVVELEVPVLFAEQGVSLGLGGAGGVEYSFSPWISAFGEVGFRYFFVQPTSDGPSQLFLQAGLRLRLPR